MTTFHRPASDLAHADYARVALWSFQQWPLLGVGFGHYDVAERAFIADHEFRTDAGFAHDPHSFYLRLLGEGGTIGLLLALVAGLQLTALVRTVYSATRNARSRALIQGVAVGVIAFLCGVALFLGGVMSRQFAGPHAVIFGAIAGLAVYGRSATRGNRLPVRGATPNDRGSDRRWHRAAWFGISLLGVAAAVNAVRPLVAPPAVDSKKAAAYLYREAYDRWEYVEHARSYDPQLAATAILEKARAAYEFGDTVEALDGCLWVMAHYPRLPAARQAADFVDFIEETRGVPHDTSIRAAAPTP
jgi:hypothetical protein